MSLISKDENISTSILYIGYLILKEISKSTEKRISIYDVASILRKNNSLNNEQLTYSLMLLYSVGIIEFEEPYIYTNV